MRASSASFRARITCGSILQAIVGAVQLFVQMHHLSTMVLRFAGLFYGLPRAVPFQRNTV